MSSSATARGTKLIDNERTNVWEWHFAKKGDSTGWHRHGHDYVVVPLMDGTLKIVSAEGESFAQMKAGVPYYRPEGVEHDVINWNDGPYAFIEVELKS